MTDSTDEAARTDRDRDYIQSIERGFAVLLAFDASRPNPTLAELAAATELSRPAVRRILLTLQRLGYVAGSGGRWSLTPRVLSIGQHYTASHSLADTAMPHLLKIVESVHESASLGVLDGADVVYAARVPVRRIMSINVSVGTRIPAYATSMGRVLLAWASPDVVDSVVADAGFGRHLTPTTVSSGSDLERELAIVRSRGYALTSQELEVGLISLAAPVRDATGVVVGALACSSSSARTTPEAFESDVAQFLVEVAAEFSTDLGARR
ncbi:IclR family transcriptional regulator domain-containing protein [Williamsia soli]|uniref:IclR family transcriptional regulator domain-containing protein n=1 Tax=Williamsia soli TaxID=364929 RepID=UPI001A9FB780|nr:IclR family transcriptional regulator C-terminal domain-containing protein [Williamsia soli]